MPITKSAEKAMRLAQRRTVINKGARSKAKTMIVKAETQLAAGSLDEARDSVKMAQSALDRAAEKGMLHPNNAARRKSRLMKKANKAAKKPA